MENKNIMDLTTAEIFPENLKTIFLGIAEDEIKCPKLNTITIAYNLEGCTDYEKVFEIASRLLIVFDDVIIILIGNDLIVTMADFRLPIVENFLMGARNEAELYNL